MKHYIVIRETSGGYKALPTVHSDFLEAEEMAQTTAKINQCRAWIVDFSPPPKIELVHAAGPARKFGEPVA